MTRAYRPRLSTIQLADDVRRVPGVASVRIVAPSHGYAPRPARLLVRFAADAVNVASGAIGSPSAHGRLLTLGQARALIATDADTIAARLAADLGALPDVASVRVLPGARLRIVGTDGAVRVDSVSEARSDIAFARAIAYAVAEGTRDGHAAGTWTVDGNTTPDAARAILRDIADGDPAVLDQLPAADLSGQWADRRTGPQLAADAVLAAGVDVAQDAGETDEWFTDICDAYETAFAVACETETVRLARAVLGGFDVTRATGFRSRTVAE